MERTASAPDPAAAVLVCLDFGGDAHEDAIEEFVRLAESAGARRHAVIDGRRGRPDPKFFAGSGKVAEIGRAARDLNAAFVLFNHPLSGAQQASICLRREARLQRPPALRLSPALPFKPRPASSSTCPTGVSKRPE